MDNFRPLNKDEISKEIEKIKENCQIIKYEGSTIYLIDDLRFLNLKHFKKSAEILNSTAVKYKKKKDPFFDYAKILNDSEFPIIAYKTFLKHKYINVSDPKKVKDRIEVEYCISKNDKEKFYRDLLNENKDFIDDEFIKRIENEKEEALKKIDTMKTFINDNYDSLDIRITTFKDNKLYPHIKMIDAIGKESIDFLRAEVPNFMYVHKNLFILQPGYRKDAKHIKFVLEAEHAFGEVYFKQKGLN